MIKKVEFRNCMRVIYCLVKVVELTKVVMNVDFGLVWFSFILLFMSN